MEQSQRRVYIGLAIFIFGALLCTLYGLTLAGSGSNNAGIPNIFLVKLISQEVADFVVQVGYFGVCAGIPGALTCVPSLGKSGSDLAKDFFNQDAVLADKTSKLPSYSQSQPLFSAAITLQTHIFIRLLAFSCGLFAIGFLLNTVYVVWAILERRGKASDAANAIADTPPQVMLRYASFGVKWIAFCLALAATTGADQSSGSLEYISESFTSGLRISVGSTSRVLHWLIVAWSFVLGICEIFVLPLKNSATTASAPKRADAEATSTLATKLGAASGGSTLATKLAAASGGQSGAQSGVRILGA